jgi:hypothetical protein
LFFDQESNRFTVYTRNSECRESAFLNLLSDDEINLKKITLARTPIILPTPDYVSLYLTQQS